MADRAPARAGDLIVAVDQAIEDLTQLRHTMTEAVIRAHRDTDTGFSSGGSGEHVTQSSIPDRATAEHALQLADRPDFVAANARKMVDAISATRAMSQMALRCARTLLPITHERAEQLVAEIEGGPAICANCKCDVWRTPNDRLRAGRCNPCYQYRIRHDGIERPQQLWEPQADRGADSPSRVVSSA